MNNLNHLKSFKIEYCDRMLVELYRHSHASSSERPAHSATISDPHTLASLISLLRELPDVGDIMVKMGDVELLVVTLFYQDKPLGYFCFFGSTIQTPDTSFFAPQRPQEISLYQTLTSLLGN